MATTDAIAFVADTLVAVLQQGLTGLVLPANVVLSTPDELGRFTPRQPSVTVLLYQVGVHGEMRNAPRRVLASGATQRPPLPLELHFLITPWTPLPRDAYRILGAAARTLYDRTVLGFADLLGPGTWAPDDTVELLLESLPVETQFDIWKPADIPYRLSLSCLARVVGIDSALSSGGAPVVVVTVVPTP